MRLLDISFAFGSGLVSHAIGECCGANIKLKSPSAVPVDLTAPQINRTDLGHACVQQHGHMASFTSTGSPEHGANGRQGRGLLRVQRDHFPWAIGQSRARDKQGKLDRLGDRQLKTGGQLDFAAWFGVARNKTNGLGVTRFHGGHTNIVATGDARGDPHALASLHHSVVCGAAGHRQVQAVIVQHNRFPRAIAGLKPGRQHFQQPPRGGPEKQKILR